MELCDARIEPIDVVDQLLHELLHTRRIVARVELTERHDARHVEHRVEQLLVDLLVFRLTLFQEREHAHVEQEHEARFLIELRLRVS